MINSKQLVDLPEVFVSFETEKIEGCRVVYLNEELAAGQSSATILDRYSYVVNTKAKAISDRSRIKIFMAERYGGEGILYNGGGGRCGFDGVWQLKGLGPNQLVGKDSGAAYGDGNVCLSVAIYESLWAEIITHALPFGAIRTVAILDTGLEYESWAGVKTRGLLVRKSVVRPAHFIRAVYFKEKTLNRLSDDAQRVKLAIANLVDFLPRPLTLSPVMELHERLESGLIELAGRYAEQFAAARVKGIAHFNVSASNLSLDGAWLDLSGARLFMNPNLHDQVSIDRYNEEYVPAIESLQHLCYYLGKYSIITNDQAKKTSDTITEKFTQAYKEHSNLYHVAQTGFPLWILKTLKNSTDLLNFSQHLRKFLGTEDLKTKTLVIEDIWSGYERWITPLYRALLVSKRESKISVELSSWQPDKKLTNQLFSSFSKLFDLATNVAHKKQIDLQSLYRCMAINITRLNRSPNFLHDLEGKIKQIQEHKTLNSKDAYESLAEEAVHCARFHFESEQPPTTPVWLSSELSIIYNPVLDIFTLKTPEHRLESNYSLANITNDDLNLIKIQSFYYEFWNILNE